MRVEGTDASTLLQGVVTCDVFSGSEATYSMMLNVQVSFTQLLDVRFLLVFTCKKTIPYSGYFSRGCNFRVFCGRV